MRQRATFSEEARLRFGVGIAQLLALPFLAFFVASLRHFLAAAVPLSGREIVPRFWARNCAQILGIKSCPESGRKIVPRFWAQNRAQILGSSLQTQVCAHFLGGKSCPDSGRKIVPRFWAQNRAQILGAKSCPNSGRKILPTFWSQAKVDLRCPDRFKDTVSMANRVPWSWPQKRVHRNSEDGRDRQSRFETCFVILSEGIASESSNSDTFDDDSCRNGNKPATGIVRTQGVLLSGGRVELGLQAPSKSSQLALAGAQKLGEAHSSKGARRSSLRSAEVGLACTSPGLALTLPRKKPMVSQMSAYEGLWGNFNFPFRYLGA